MALVNLTRQEREKFANHLRQEAESDKLMLEQLKKLGPAGEMLLPRMEQNIAASILVAQKLQDVEMLDIGSAEPDWMKCIEGEGLCDPNRGKDCSGCGG